MDEALLGSIRFYSASLYPLFDNLGEVAAKEIAMAAEEANSRYPCWMRNAKGEFPEFELPHLGKKSSVFCIAAMSAYLAWTVLKAGMELPDSPLLEAAQDGWQLWKMEKKVRCVK